MIETDLLKTDLLMDVGQKLWDMCVSGDAVMRVTSLTASMEAVNK